MSALLKYAYAALALFMSLPALVKAQNNIYQINDTCFAAYEAAEKALGTPEFKDFHAQLVKVCEEHSDTKALTLASILNLSQAISLKDETLIPSAFEETKSIALSAGYMQYYYFAYTKVASYYFNNHQVLKALSTANLMREDSERFGDEYGRWNCSRFLGTINSEMYHFQDARRYLLEAVDIYDNSADPTVRRQSLARTLMDLSDTYQFVGDSVRVYLDRAIAESKTHLDTLRHAFYMARYAAVTKDIHSYQRFKTACMRDPSLKKHLPLSDVSFLITDLALDSEWAKVGAHCDSVDEYSVLCYAQALAEVYGAPQISAKILKKMNATLEVGIQSSNSDVLSELNAQYETSRLSEELMKKTLKTNHLLLLVVILTLMMIVGVIVFSVIYLRKVSMAKDAAEAANLMKVSFVQNMSHEIRTPLNAIVGFSQLLSLPEGTLSDEEKAQYSGYIENNSAMLTMLIDDILDLSDVDSGNYHVMIEECNCNDICRKAMNSVEYRVPGDVSYRFSTDVPDDFTIYSDSRRIQQVLVNYLTNSCKHTEEGEIHVSCSLNENPGKLTFSVADTGGGIAPEDADRIFQRFSKLDPFKQGSGLGLNICTIIAEKLGGEVRLDKTYGRCSGNGTAGARFQFILPLPEKS